MLYPQFQSEAYITDRDNRLYRINRRKSTGDKPSEFEIEIEDAVDHVVCGDERMYVTRWLTYKQIRDGGFKVQRQAPRVPQLPVAAAAG